MAGRPMMRTGGSLTMTVSYKDQASQIEKWIGGGSWRQRPGWVAALEKLS
jgi:hypothetical protein